MCKICFTFLFPTEWADNLIRNLPFFPGTLDLVNGRFSLQLTGRHSDHTKNTSQGNNNNLSAWYLHSFNSFTFTLHHWHGKHMLFWSTGDGDGSLLGGSSGTQKQSYWMFEVLRAHCFIVLLLNFCDFFHGTFLRIKARWSQCWLMSWVTEAIILSQPNTEKQQFWTKTTVINYCSLIFR